MYRFVRAILLVALLCLPAILTATVSAQACPLEPRLTAPGDALVVSGMPLRGRSGPSTDNRVLGAIQPQTQLSVLDGPECANGYNWYRVRQQGSEFEAWVAEGGNGVYWLSRIVVAPPADPVDESAIHHRIDYYACSSTETWFKLALLPWDMGDDDYYDVRLAAEGGAVFNHVLPLPETQTADQLRADLWWEIPIMWFENLVGLVPGIAFFYELGHAAIEELKLKSAWQRAEDLQEMMAKGVVRLAIDGGEDQELRVLVQASHPEGGGVYLGHQLNERLKDEDGWKLSPEDMSRPGRRVC